MPLPTEHAARQLDPDGFEKFRRGELDGAPEGITAIFGIKADGDSEVQSIRAEAAAVTVEEFRAWLESAGFKAEIEEATGEEEPEPEEAPEAAEGGDFSELVWGAPLVVLASTTAETSWVEVVRSGEFFGNAGPNPRRVEFTDDDVQVIVDNWALTDSEGWFTGGMPVGYNHATAAGALSPDSTRAAARIRQVETRTNSDGGLSLWGLFEWTDEGATRIREGEFAAVSAELLPPTVATSKLTGEPIGGWTLVGATLTNAPMIPSMRPPSVSGMAYTATNPDVRVTYLTETTENPTMKNPTLSTLSEIVGVTESGLLSEVRRLQAEASKVETLTESLDIATKDLEELRVKTADLEGREKTRILDEACAKGRIAPTEREDYWALLELRGEERANALFAEDRLGVSRLSEAASGESTDDSGARFLTMIDAKLAEGLSESEAWDAAKIALGSSIYPTTVEA